jgi:mannose-6-phosphate isomerase-like protein (cupin superfamily)
MTSPLTNKSVSPRYLWGKNCESFVLLNNASLSVKQEIMPPGSEEILHYHVSARQLFFILAGEATFEIDGKEIRAKASEAVRIDPGQKHFIRNQSSENIEFLVISQPATENDRVNV